MKEIKERKIDTKKTYSIFKNGTQQGTIKAISRKQAESIVFATYGEHREVIISNKL